MAREAIKIVSKARNADRVSQLLADELEGNLPEKVEAKEVVVDTNLLVKAIKKLRGM